VCACDMNSQCRSSREAFVAMMAAVCLLMWLDVCPKSVAREALPTDFTHRVFLLTSFCMCFPVMIQTSATNKSLMTYRTFKRLVASVCPDMFPQVFLSWKWLTAYSTLKHPAFVFSMNISMFPKCTLRCKCTATLFARKWFRTCMYANVKLHLTWSIKSLPTVIAFHNSPTGVND
jgi:hypothetical protein